MIFLIRTIRILTLVVFTVGIYSRGWSKDHPYFSVTWAACQPYPYNALTFDGVYQGNLFSNLGLEYSFSPYWAVTGAFGNDVLKWKNNQWIVDPVNQIVVSNVYLSTWHTLGGVKISPWGEFTHDNFWKFKPYFTLEGGLLYFQALDLNSGLLDYLATAPMAGGGVGLEIGFPDPEEDVPGFLKFLYRNVRFMMEAKYFSGFTPYNLQYIPFRFGLKVNF